MPAEARKKPMTCQRCGKSTGVNVPDRAVCLQCVKAADEVRRAMKRSIFKADHVKLVTALNRRETSVGHLRRKGCKLVWTAEDRWACGCEKCEERPCP